MGSDVVWVETGTAEMPDGERLTISQMADRYGVTPRALRFYESQGLI